MSAHMPVLTSLGLTVSEVGQPVREASMPQGHGSATLRSPIVLAGDVTAGAIPS